MGKRANVERKIERRKRKRERENDRENGESKRGKISPWGPPMAGTRPVLGSVRDGDKDNVERDRR